jgi:hypothetical protein
MSEHVVAISRRLHLPFVAHVVALFAVFYAYVLLRVRPELFYQQQPDVFLFDTYFFAGFVRQPGGLVEYASAFLSPLFAFGWMGSLVVTLLATLICLATRQYVAAITGAGGRFVFLIPALLILMVLGRYSHPVTLCVGLCVVLVFANVYVRMGKGHPFVRLAAFLIASVLAYYVAAGMYVIFAFLCGIFEWRVNRNRSLGVFCVLCAGVVPSVVGTWLCDMGIRETYRGLALPAARYWLAVPSSALVTMSTRVALFLFFPVVAVAAALCRRPAALRTFTPETTGQPETLEETDRKGAPPTSMRRLAVQTAVLIVVGLGADIALFDSPTKYSLLVAHSAERQKWADVLTHARHLPPSDVWNVFHVNRALYHRGELLDRMFDYPQSINTPTLTLWFENLTMTAQRAPLDCSDVLFDLGRINESEHMAYEALEKYGERPHTLKRLIYINVIKGEPEAARRFLALLDCSLLHRQWARHCRRQLDADPTLSGVPVIASRRELMMLDDHVGSLDLETMLEQLLERNPRNRMAFEYLMAHYLLTRQLEKMVANLHRFEEFDCARLPRHCEEAFVVYLATGGSQDVDLGGYQIHPETRRRYGDFIRALGRFQGNARAAFIALHHDFGDSYFFSHTFGHNDLQFILSRPSR